MREFAATELPGLNELVEADDKNAGRIWTVMAQVQADDSSATVEGNRLREALGHPESQAGVAADQVDFAYVTFYKDVDPVAAKWRRRWQPMTWTGRRPPMRSRWIRQQRYIDARDTISWPPGTFEGQANTLRRQSAE